MSGASTAALLARLVVSLGVVLGLMFVIAHFLRRRGIGGAPARGSGHTEVELLARRGLGRNTSIAVVRAAGRGMVVGVTEASITHLADVDLTEIDLMNEEARRTRPPDRPDPSGAAAPSPAWKTGLSGVLDAWRERTIRRGP
jgi:flagellar biosynthetic protein FliO